MLTLTDWLFKLIEMHKEEPLSTRKTHSRQVENAELCTHSPTGEDTKFNICNVKPLYRITNLIRHPAKKFEETYKQKAKASTAHTPAASIFSLYEQWKDQSYYKENCGIHGPGWPVVLCSWGQRYYCLEWKENLVLKKSSLLFEGKNGWKNLFFFKKKANNKTQRLHNQAHQSPEIPKWI